MRFNPFPYRIVFMELIDYCETFYHPVDHWMDVPTQNVPSYRKKKSDEALMPQW